MNILLNNEQLQAVKQTEGPVRIIAGPGSGKTRTIVSKIAHILNEGLARPEEILAITFTNKAANEIKDRISAEGKTVWNVFTYHGWCSRFLRIEAQAAGLSEDFTILDSTDRDRRIRNLIKENDLAIDKSDAMNAFEKIAREEIKLSELKASKQSALVQISILWDKYKNDKRTNGQLDFNDLIIEVKKLLTENEFIAETWKNKYKYIFIDEFQDTNNVQFEIIKAITNPDSNITVVGDPDQNIYSWRGANIELINNFEKWYPKSKTIMLKTNYRSTPEIIAASNSLIKNNKKRVQTFEALPFKNYGSTVEIMEKENDIDEAYSLVRRIEGLRNSGYEYHEISIIVRSAYKTRPLETALNHFGVPYRVIGAMRFFERREVKQVLQFLKFSARQEDRDLLDIINEPPKKFGPSKINKTKFLADESNLSMWNFLKENKDKESEVLRGWIIQTEKMVQSIQNNEDPVVILESYLDDINYINRLFDEPNRIENIKETLKLVRVALQKNSGNNISEKIISFINSTTLESSADKSIEHGEVNIVTSHASKGTEFPVVFLFNMVEGHWPSKQSIENGKFEEERRVAYVAMTRAMDKLIITTSNGYNNYNQLMESSRFINELLTTNSFDFIESDIDKPRAPDVEWKDDNTNVQVGQKIFHNTFGEGEILSFDSEFIKVVFDEKKIQEILKGHQSYKIIK